MLILTLVALILISLLAGAPRRRAPRAPRTVSGPARVLDGDGLLVAGHRVRLFGIDAPEFDQVSYRDGVPVPSGREAQQHLRALIGNREVVCDVRDVDRFGRLVAVCKVDGLDLNAEMVAAGHALAYRAFSKAYVAQENAARRARRGLWATEFVAPWAHRRRRG